ncbi:MAG: DUF427 domain-containing protein [Polaromonas sp.]|nr:DUF427 domain-containing protein [Polaromonas sp.]
MKAIWKETIAERDGMVEVWGNAYSPLASPNRRYKQGSNTHSDTHSVCRCKGGASSLSLKAWDAINPDAAWNRPSPFASAEQVRDRVAFWRGAREVA